jgi:signal transduction histidine kinase
MAALDAARVGVTRARGLDRRAAVVVALGVVGVVSAIATGWLVAHSGVLLYPLSDAIVRSAYVAVYVAVGAYTWYRRPGIRLGCLLVANGLAFAVVTLNASDGAVMHTLGMMVWAAWIVFTALVFLSFPRGRLESGLERGFVAALALSNAIVWTLMILLADKLPVGGDFTSCGDRCPHNAFQLVSMSARVSSALNVAYATTTTIGLLGIAMLIFMKARSPSRVRRRTMEPLSYVLIATIVEFVLAAFLIVPAYPAAMQSFRVSDALLTFAIPVAIIVGQLRGNVFAASRAGEMIVSTRGTPVTPEGIQQLLREATGDPGLILARSAEAGGYIDAEGVPVGLSADGDRDRRAVTLLAANGHSAALIHDPLVEVDTPVLETLAATALMLLENAELVDEVRASRRRLAASAASERRRLEHDLHDGAQQRLLAIQVGLDDLLSKIDDEQLSEEILKISNHATAALDQLRDLARGIYPSVLSDLGVGPALTSAAIAVPTRVLVVDEGLGRCDPAIESAVYFCVTEALQNATKHAGPDTQVTITLHRQGDAVMFEVADDGFGFNPRAASGTGLLSMSDRVEALGGKLTITSEHGHGTTIRGLIPSSSAIEDEPSPTSRRATG